MRLTACSEGAAGRWTRLHENKAPTHLTLVGPVVSLLGVLDLQRPVVGTLGVQHAEAHIRRVGVDARGENVEVRPSDPGHL